MKIITVIQARMGSTRLPKKVMMPLLGKPLIIRMIERVSLSNLTGTIVAALTEERYDDELANVLKNQGLNVFRGSTNDLLERHLNAAREYGGDTVIKIPSDCPLIDPSVIDKVINYYTSDIDSYDYVSNLHPATYPDGNDVEIMSLEILERCSREASKDFEREHTTPYIWENPEKFRIGNVEWETGLDYSMSHRWTIDYMEDYLFIKKIYEELYDKNPEFGLNDILNYEKEHPEVKAINEKYNGVNWYRNHLGDLKTIKPEQTKVI
jgi:spore coat polysaccharide biosynthesis protein SpsF